MFGPRLPTVSGVILPTGEVDVGVAKPVLPRSRERVGGVLGRDLSGEIPVIVAFARLRSLDRTPSCDRMRNGLQTLR